MYYWWCSKQFFPNHPAWITYTNFLFSSTCWFFSCRLICWRQFQHFVMNGLVCSDCLFYCRMVYVLHITQGWSVFKLANKCLLRLHFLLYVWVSNLEPSPYLYNSCNLLAPIFSLMYCYCNCIYFLEFA